MASARARGLFTITVVAVSTPLAMVLESLLRGWLMPPEFDEARAWWGPSITPWMWLMPPLAAIGTPLGLVLQRWLVRRNIEGLPSHRRTPTAEAAAVLDAMLLSTSVPQVPAVIGTMGLLLGAAATPVLVAVAVSTVGVLVIGLVSSRRLAESS